MKVNSMYSKYCSPLRIIRPLLRICVLWSITPPYEFGQVKPIRGSFKIRSLAVLVIVLAGYFYHLYGQQKDGAFENLEITINLIDYFTMLLITVTNVAVVVSICFWNAQKFFDLLHSLEAFDSNFQLRLNGGSSTFWFGFVLAQIGIISTLTVDIATWINYAGIRLYKYYIPRDLQWYQFCLALFLIFWLAVEVKRRFRRVNTLLWQSIKGFGKEALFTTRIDVNDKPFLIRVANYKLLRSVKVWYAHLIKVMDDFNSLFGIVLLCAVLFNITNVVFYTQLVMVYVVFQSGDVFGAYIMANSLMWIGAGLLQTMLIAAACDGLAREANRLPEVCYILLNDIPSIPNTEYDRVLKDELLLIADQSSSKKICVSAAGFFDVNFGMMGFIVASITSYIIVTIQFVSDE